MLQLLEDERRGALGEDEAVAAASNGRLAAGGIVVARGQGTHGREAAHRGARSTDASQPPANMMSASPRRMISLASPMACPTLAQALVVEKLGPRAPKTMPATPDAMLAMAMGMKNGLRRVSTARERDADLVDERARAAQAGRP